MHTSIAGGLPASFERARALGCSAFQIFSHNPRGWALTRRAEGEIAAFRKMAGDFDISPVVIHTSYLINMASGAPALWRRSVDMVAEEMEIADSIGARYVVLHTGSASGDEPAGARKRAAAGLAEVAGRGKWRAGLLLENTAGERGDIASKIGEMADIVDRVPSGLIAGICLDTCHAFAAGYDIASRDGLAILAGEIRKHLGKRSLRLIHLNDSKGVLSSGLDRHEHIGEGRIGIEGFKRFLGEPFFSGVPLILETPKKTEEDDPRNLRVVRGLLEETASSDDSTSGVVKSRHDAL
ncbi:MAG: deoxyribonuclease IV [Nitrospiraceae bacterium]|nr:deoxyribonuclease IV [Nitrospiraceae bacterium]